MTEIKTEVKTYRVEKICETCNKGKLVYTGQSMSIGWSSKHIHRCFNQDCNQVKDLPNTYPRIEHEEISPDTRIIKIQPFVLEKHKHYITSKQMKVFIWEVDEIKSIFIDVNGRHYLADGTNVDHNPESTSVFIPDSIVTSY